MAHSLAGPEHRPWPVPRRPWLMAQSWLDTLVLHWQVEPDLVAPLLPDGVVLDTRDGKAWVGILAFRVAGARPRLMPPLPGLSDFPEVNVRTYVNNDGRPGVWFFSLDAQSRLAAILGPRAVHLPYYYAGIDMRVRPGAAAYRLRRASAKAAPAAFRAWCRTRGHPEPTPPGSLESWLMDRYCFVTEHDGTLQRCEVDHLPWAVQPADAVIAKNTLLSAAGIRAEGPPDHVCYSPGVDTRIWALERAG